MRLAEIFLDIADFGLAHREVHAQFLELALHLAHLGGARLECVLLAGNVAVARRNVGFELLEFGSERLSLVFDRGEVAFDLAYLLPNVLQPFLFGIQFVLEFA